MIVMFGDHQPGIEDEFFDEAMGVESAKAPNEQKMCWYEDSVRDLDQLRPACGGYGTLRCDLPFFLRVKAREPLTDSVQRVLLQLSEKLPIIHHLGIWGVGRNFLPWLGGRGSGEYSGRNS